MKCESCGKDVEPGGTVTIDCDGCWKAAAKMYEKLKEQGKKIPQLSKDAIAAFKRLKIVIQY